MPKKCEEIRAEHLHRIREVFRKLDEAANKAAEAMREYFTAGNNHPN